MLLHRNYMTDDVTLMDILTGPMGTVDKPMGTIDSMGMGRMGIHSPYAKASRVYAITTLIRAGNMDGIDRPMRYMLDTTTHPTVTLPNADNDSWPGVHGGVHRVPGGYFGIFTKGAGAPGAVPTFQEGGI